MTTLPLARHFTRPAPRLNATFLAPIQREFDRMIEQIGDGWSAFEAAELSPSVDICDTKDALEITAEVPGMAIGDIKLSVEDGVLTVSGEKKSESDRTEGERQITERAYGAFSRSFTLPSSIDPDKLSASMKDGVLKISAPKTGEVRAKTIPIAAA